MTVETLCSIIGGFAGAHTVVSSAEGSLTVEQLLRNADELYRTSQVAPASRVALCGLSVDVLLAAVVAFDGRVAAMLLLPASLDGSSRDELVAAAGCTHLIDDAGLHLLHDDAGAAVEPLCAATAWLLATSGTTGTPKIIGHTLASLTRTVKRERTRGGDFVWGLLYDPSRFAGLQVVLQALLSGSLLVVSSKPDLRSQVGVLAGHRVNALSATPSLWRKLLMDGRIAQCSLRQVTLGGEIADQQILDGLRIVFPEARIVHIYASTEAGAAFSVHDGRAGFPAAWIEQECAPLPLKIRDDGHLLLRPQVMPGGKEIEKRLDPEGYLDTGDVVAVEGGRVVFRGRASGAINVGGNKVMPEYIENHIRHVAGVRDVRVFGKKSSMMGQIVAADIVCDSGFDSAELRREILRYCCSVMESWQVPAMLSFAGELHENAAGKRERVM
jgi:acyl-coenzyme A synthetase/AMP-(fatty) acid ligase